MPSSIYAEEGGDVDDDDFQPLFLCRITDNI